LFLHLEPQEDASDPELPLAPELGAFNHIEVEVSVKLANSQKRSTLIVATVADGRILVKAQAPVPFGPGVHRIAIDLPYRGRLGGRPDTLRVGLRGAERWTLGRVQLHEDDWAARLPLPERPAPVSMGNQTRPAVGLTTTRPLTVSFTAPEDAELSIAYGVPPELRSGQQTPVLVTSIRSGERVVREVRSALRPLEEGARSPESWQDESISLAGLAGPLTASFALEVDGRLPAFAALAVPTVLRRARGAPTVLLITSDTHRYDHVRVAGTDVELDTPALDRLASQGVFYEGCFTATNVTNPSHTALLTGVHPRDTRVLDNVTALASEATTLAEVFQEAGFVTFACVSVPHLAHERSGLGQGFDRMSFPRFKKRPAEASIAELEGWLAEAQAVPVFAWLHLFDAHTPYAPPAPFDRLYYPKDRDPYDATLPAPQRHQLPPEEADLRDLDYPAAQYKAEVTYLDDALSALLEQPRVRDGIVLFTADHGESLGAHDIYWGHSGLYPDTVHVPLILRYPEAPAGTRVRTPVQQIDAARTLLDLAGLHHLPFDGQSLLATLDEKDASPRTAPDARYLLSSHAFDAAVHSDRWLLILCLMDHPVSGGTEHRQHRVELYDLERDPDCHDDVATAELDTARTLRRDLIAWLGARRADGLGQAAPGDVGTDDQLTALGYTARATKALDDTPLFDTECECSRCAAFE
jgi:arylsulfatase A-like enzyme